MRFRKGNSVKKNYTVFRFYDKDSSIYYKNRSIDLFFSFTSFLFTLYLNFKSYQGIFIEFQSTTFTKHSFKI